ncbi:MAG: UvrD-helicase domain-containing protein [Anaerolineaceae bacterium]|nr:UvrD-helicase domain-containing protein [Anaerolineaceae bacterium]MCB9100799.1 UvrD-helicase domain-containing protein [Anaerolineales bacterium]
MMDFLEGLNPAQKEAVTTIEGPVLALAGPGSGKTRALTHRIGYLVRDWGIAPWNILAVTFTNKAAREMKNRLEGLLTKPQVDALSVGTFHSLCARWLRQDIEALGNYDRNYVIYDTSDQQSVVKRALRDLDIDEKAWKPNPIHYAISKAKNEMLGPDRFPTRTYQDEIIQRVYSRYQAILVQNNALDFDDLLLLTHRLFNNHPAVLQKYQQRFLHVMVDEFQDTNMVQYELSKMLAGGSHNIFVVGDLDQGVYSWRGADYRNVLRFRDDYPDLKLIQLSQNYRSTETILDAAKQVIRKNKERIDNDLFTKRGTGPKIRVIEAYNDREEAIYVVNEIQRLERDGISPGEIAVMYRTNAQSRALEEAFIAHNMPYVLVRGTRFYDRKEIKDALAYLRLLHNPEDSVSLERIINVPPRGIGNKTIADLDRWAFELGATPWQAIRRLVVEADAEQEDNEATDIAYPPAAVPSPFKGRAQNALVQFGQMMTMLLAAKRKLPLPDLYDLMIARTGYKAFIKDNTMEGEERWENLQELKQVTHDFATIEGDEALALFLENVALVSDVDALGEEGSAPALLTLHTAKGLEFPVVFMVGMEENIFPHSRSLQDPEQMEEERRLAYVGITRAKDRLYLTRAFRRTTYGFEEPTAPSRFLNDIPPELVDQNGQRSSRGYPTGGGRFTGRREAQRVSSRWDRPAAPSVPSAGKAPGFKPGDRVYHGKFGEGTVIAVELTGSDEYVQVAFPNQGIKKLATSIAKLEKLS